MLQWHFFFVCLYQERRPPRLCSKAASLTYVNDLPQCLTRSKCILYADDTTIFSYSPDLEILISDLQNDLCCLTLIKIFTSSQKTVYFPEAIDHVCPLCVPCIGIWPLTFCVLQVSFVFPSSMCTVYFPKAIDSMRPPFVQYVSRRQ